MSRLARCRPAASRGGLSAGQPAVTCVRAHLVRENEQKRSVSGQTARLKAELRRWLGGTLQHVDHSVVVWRARWGCGAEILGQVLRT